MSAENLTDGPVEPEATGRAAEEDSDLLASKLSKELNNWRRRRTSGQPRRNDGPRGNFQSDSARTIKVRGHETLVIRKPKLSPKPPTANSDRDSR
jgi:hypothetical protein